jgi:hypothetical protein
MGLNRQLVETVKTHFAQKSTAELQEIVRLKDLDRWSEEALIAADEVLAERTAGRAKEPRVPVKDAPPPSPGESIRELLPVLGFVTGGLLGGLIGRALVAAAGEVPNRPVSFGSDLAWVAVETTDTQTVAGAFGLQRQRPAMWEEGIAAAYKSEVFVTPPLGDWTLAASTALFPPEGVETFVKPLLVELSKRFRDAQYFCTHKDAGAHIWARAQKGKLFRGYGWHGGRSSVIWNEGPQTKQEFTLGFRFTDGPTTPPVVKRADDPTTADESCVMQLASLWSVDPSALDEYFAEPVAGLIGELPRSKA